MTYVKWYGADDCPVGADANVELILRNNKIVTAIAGDWRWSHFKDGMDIVEYRVLKNKRKT